MTEPLRNASYFRSYRDDWANVDRLKDEAAERGDHTTHVDVLREELEAEASAADLGRSPGTALCRVAPEPAVALLPMTNATAGQESPDLPTAA